MRYLRVLFPVLLLLVFSFFAFRPLLIPGFFPIHDNTQVQRVFEMNKSLQDGMFPVRWVEDLGFGYGYPLFNFYNPLPYYAGAAFGLLGLSALSSTKLMMILGILIAGFSMYLLSKEFWGEMGGVLSGLFYMYAPYHAVDIFVRGDVAEFWAYAFIPLVFYGFWKLYKDKKWRYFIVSSLSYAALITSHNLTALMASPFIFVFVIYLLVLSYGKEKKVNIKIILALVSGLLISAFYWLPALYEMSYTNVISQIGGGANYRDNFVCLSQLWSSPWGYGGSVKGCNDGLSFMVGKYHLILSSLIFLFSLLVLFSNKTVKAFSEEREKFFFVVAAFISLLLSLFFTLSASSFIWNILKPMAFLQYPWRFLVLASFFSSFISGALLLILKKLLKDNFAIYVLSVLSFSLIVALSIKFFVPQTVTRIHSSDFTSKHSLEWVTSNITSEYMPKGFDKPKTEAGVSDFSKINSSDVKVLGLQRKTNRIFMTIEVFKASRVNLPLAYFPAWQAFLDNRKITLSQSPKGMDINLPVGIHKLYISFVQTPVEKMSDLLSFAGILILFIGIIQIRKKYGK